MISQLPLLLSAFARFQTIAFLIAVPVGWIQPVISPPRMVLGRYMDACSYYDGECFVHLAISLAASRLVCRIVSSSYFSLQNGLYLHSMTVAPQFFNDDVAPDLQWYLLSSAARNMLFNLKIHQKSDPDHHNRWKYFKSRWQESTNSMNLSYSSLESIVSFSTSFCKQIPKALREKYGGLCAKPGVWPFFPSFLYGCPDLEKKFHLWFQAFSRSIFATGPDNESAIGGSYFTDHSFKFFFFFSVFYLPRNALWSTVGIRREICREWIYESKPCPFIAKGSLYTWTIRCWPSRSNSSML